MATAYWSKIISPVAAAQNSALQLWIITDWSNKAAMIN